MAIDRDIIASWVDLCAQLLNSLAVDPDTPGQDNLLGSPAGGHAGIGEEFLQANHWIAVCGLRVAH